MKFNLLALLLFLVSCTSNSAQKQENTEGTQIFNIEIPNKQGGKVYLARYSKENAFAIDSVTLSDTGKGTITYIGNKLNGQYLLLSKPEIQLDLLITDQQDNIDLYIDTQDFSKCKVTGSEDTQLLWKYLQKQNEHQQNLQILEEQLAKVSGEKELAKIKKKIEALELKKFDSIKQQIKSNKGTWFASFVKGLQNIDIPSNIENDKKQAYKYLKEHYFDNIDLTDIRFWSTNYFEKKIDLYFENLVGNQFDKISEAAIMLVEKSKTNDKTYTKMLSKFVNESQHSTVMGDENVWAKLAEEYIFDKEIAWIDSATMSELRKQYSLLENNRIGMTAKDMKLVKIDGDTIQTNEVDAKITLIYFYDMYCSHCARETPKLQKDIYQKYKDKGLKIIAISLDPDISHDTWDEYIKKNSMSDWINCADPDYNSQYWLNYDVSGTPTMYILDKNKIIVGRKLSHESLSTIIDYYIEQ